MGFCAFIGGGVTTLTYVGETNTSTTGGTLTPHGSAAAGDLAVLCSFVSNGSALATPSGWTAIVSNIDPGVGNTSGRCSYKKLTSGDLSTPVTGIAAGSIQRQIMLVFRPDDDIDAITLSTPSGFAGPSDPPDQTVSASGQAAPLVVIGFNGDSHVTGPDDMASSPGFDGLVDIANARAGYKIYNAAPANHTISATGLGGRVLQSFYIRVS